MPNIQSKRIRVRDPETGIWHDLPAAVSKESMIAAQQAAASAAEAEQNAEIAREAAEYNAKLPVVEAMEAARHAAENAETAEQSAAEAARNAAHVDRVLTEGVAEVVTDWLDENVDPTGTAVTVDKSLLIEGSAADAKVVGQNVAVNTRVAYIPEPAEESSTSNSVVWAWDNGALTFAGTTSSGSDYIYYNNPSALPGGIKAGEIYYVDYDTTDARVAVKIDMYVSGTAKYSESFRTAGTLNVPSDVTGIKIAERIGGGSSVSVDGEVNQFRILKKENASDAYEAKKGTEYNGVYEIDAEWYQGYETNYSYRPLNIQAPASLNNYAATGVMKMPSSGIYLYDDVKLGLKAHFWKLDANHAFVPATDYPFYVSNATAREVTNTAPRFYPYASGIYFNVSVRSNGTILASDAKRYVHIYAGKIEDNSGRLPNLAGCAVIGNYANGTVEKQELHFVENYSDISGSNLKTIDARAYAYVSIVRLQDADRIVFAPPYSGVARIYKIEDDDREISIYDEIFPPIPGYSGGGDYYPVFGQSVIDLTVYHFRGFAMIGVIMESTEYVSGSGLWSQISSNGMLAKYNDAMAHVHVAWKPNVRVTIASGIPAAAKNNIDMILANVFAADMKASPSEGGYSNYAYPSGNAAFKGKGTVKGWWYNGGNHYNVPHMHVTPKSYITASKNNHSRVYIAKVPGTSENMYGGVCSCMGGFIMGRPTGVETMIHASRLLPGMEYRDYTGMDDLRPGDLIAGIGSPNDEAVGYGHTAYVTESVSVNGEVFCVNKFEGWMPWTTYNTFVNLEAFDGYEIEQKTNDKGNILEKFSSRRFAQYDKFTICRLPAKDYKTVRNAYGPYDTQDYSVTEIMCDRGTDAVYCIGELMTLTVTDGTTSIDLYKNGTSVGTVDLTDYSAETYSDGKVYDVTGMIDSAGYYEIYVSGVKKESFYVPPDRYFTNERDSESDPDPKFTIKFDPDEENDTVAAIVVYYYEEGGLSYPLPYYTFDAETVDESDHATLEVPAYIETYEGASRRAVKAVMIRKTPYGTYATYRSYNIARDYIQRAGNPDAGTEV